MTKSFDLTAGELKVALILVSECLGGMGGSRPGDLAQDEYTWIDPKDLVARGYSRHEASGYWSSLTEKGLIFENGPKEWFLGTEAWQFLDTVWDANKEVLG